ncbi:MAG: hypothetical protein HY758_06380 [Nitrospirae bacterium]|nr:hypothetical protein [Nitrospirota bacterium]
MNIAHAQSDLDDEKTADRGLKPSAAEYYSPDFHKKNIKTLNTSRNDLLAFYIFARYLKEFNKPDELKLLEEYAREFMSKRIDPILKKQNLDEGPGVQKILFELEYLKASLFYECGDTDTACETLNKLDSRYHQEMYVPVDFMATALQQKNPYMALTMFRLVCNKKKKQ